MNKTVTGQIRTSGRGFGYLRLPEFEDVIEIQPSNMNTALDFDTVEVETRGINENKNIDGVVKKIIKRDKITWVGVVKEVFNRHTHKKEKTFSPDSFRFYPETKIVNLERFRKLKDNKKIVVKLEKWDNPKAPAEIKITKILGKIGENETEMQAAIYDRGLVMGFSKEVEDAAAQLKEKSKELIEKEINTRKDLRELKVFTIDPADAKDFDDALHVKKLDNGNIEVGVHIADPTFFVKPNSVIDKEAQKRATSIYLVDRTIPMLPEVLSNDLCSLNPNEDKLSFSLIFELNKNAEVISEWFGETVINSKRRFNYIEAQEIIDAKNGDLLDELELLMGLTEKLEKKRIKDGSIEFSSYEPKFKMDEEKFPTEIYIKPHVRTMDMIEEFALLANKRISMFISLNSDGLETKNPFIYRVHDKPKMEKITEVIDFLSKMNIYPDTDKDGNLSAKEINKVFERFRGTPEENILSLSILRSMQKAVYSPEIRGHFGLAFKYYTHFTSPIRRYPDDIAHRLVKKYLAKQPISAKEKQKIAIMAQHSSDMEQRAVMAERESIAFKYAQYYSKRIGETFVGIITGVAKFGFFVENEKTKAQGMVSVRAIGNDFYQYDEEKNILIGKSTGKIFKIGEKIKTKVINVNVNERKIDLEILH